MESLELNSNIFFWYFRTIVMFNNGYNNHIVWMWTANENKPNKRITKYIKKISTEHNLPRKCHVITKQCRKITTPFKKFNAQEKHFPNSGTGQSHKIIYTINKHLAILHSKEFLILIFVSFPFQLLLSIILCPVLLNSSHGPITHDIAEWPLLI